MSSIPHQDAALLVYSDSEALQAITKPQFQTQWRELAAKCPWATALQSPEFACTWYECYGEVYRPVVLARFGAGGEMDGLMALAVERPSGKLTLAGAHQAEYQVWLALPGEQTFVVECLENLRQLGFPSLTFTYLPPGTPLDWRTNRWSDASTLRAVQRPLLTVDDIEAVRESLAKKKNRRRLEKLQESGPMSFLELHTPQELDAYYDDIIDFYDFRMGAVNGTCPFREDPRKRALYRALMAQGQLHVTVMKIGETLVASHIGLRNKSEVVLGIVGHSPFQAIHSPGKLHILQLGMMLHEEGFANLDLTPGGDAYKEDRATRYDEAHELTLFLDKGALAGHRRSVRVQAFEKKVASVLRLNKQGLSRLRSLVRNPIRELVLLLSSARKWIWSSEETRFYRAEGGAVGAADLGIQRDSLRDLLYYEKAQADLRSKREFLSNGLAALESGVHVYSLVREKVLVNCAWVAASTSKAPANDMLRSHEYPAKSAVIYDFYAKASASRQGDGSALLRKIVNDATAEGAEAVFLAIAAEDQTGRQAAEAAGFKYQDSVVRSTRFGAEKTNLVVRANS
jgi:CelD/BcsL family acetyltransferase involved in cellulose biosynthesis